jgi:hypothetical protein
MTDQEFEALNAELQRLVATYGRREAARHSRFKELVRRLERCRDCDRDNPEAYMVKERLWRKAVPGSRIGPVPYSHWPGEHGTGGFLCLACLEARLGRPLRREDFKAHPINAAFRVTPYEGRA